MFKDITGQRFGRLTVLAPTEKRHNRSVIWLCQCDCGKVVEVNGNYMRNGDTRSCGCLHDEAAAERGRANKVHGGCRDRLHRIWTGMLTRCRNPNHPEFHRYGGRGIKVCRSWEHSYQAFKDWAYSHGYDDQAPRGVCTIDRIDVDGDYCPENCRFVSALEQSRNLSTNRKITVHGKTKCASEWAEIIGVSPCAILNAERYRGIPAESYVQYRLEHRKEHYIKTAAVLAAAEKWR